MSAPQPLSTPGLASLETNEKEHLLHPEDENSELYSPEERIWRPVFPKGDPNNDGYLPGELGALLQGIVIIYSKHIYYALLPAAFIISWRILICLFQTIGIIKNPYMKNVIVGKYNYHEPDKDGNLVGEPCQNGKAIIILSARCNHPLGMFAPGYKELGDITADLHLELESHPEKYGYRGSTAWIGGGGIRTVAQNIMGILYFDSVDSILKFAHSSAHRKAWNWWVENVQNLDHISITHEASGIKPESYETLCINSERSGLTSNNVKLPNGQFVAPIVDATEGQQRTAKGRMNWVDHGKGNDRYKQYDYKHARLVCPALRSSGV